MERGAGELPLHREETNHHVSFTAAAAVLLIQRSLNYMFDLAATRLRNIVARLGLLWPPPVGAVVVFGGREEGVLMPQSALNFIVTGLLGLAEIKSQGNNHFPFQLHPKTAMLVINSFLMYGFASAAEHFISVSQIGSDSVYAFIARLGRIASLCILVVSPACLFYF